jgi:phosphoribosylformylglycinamidine synthase
MAGDLLYVMGTTRNELGASEYYELLGYVGLNVPTLQISEVRPLYEALERSLAEGIAASCHGIYRGGLGVHAALMCFGSGLGMELDLSAVPSEGALRDDQVLFSESCGRFLVTVPRSAKSRFESFFAGMACALVGEITEEPRLVIRVGAGNGVLNEDVQSLKAGWLAGPEGISDP